ncbi:MAG: hypothetical protein QM570_15250 [Planctomycetota bacterium]|nr:hypothetical protein [Planctomycetota bacterium]
MANEIHVDHPSGQTVYAVIRNPAGQVWRPAAQAFEDWGDAGHEADDYDIALSDKGGSRYLGDFDANIPSGRYTIQCFVQAGAAPAQTDTLIDSRTIHWTGTGELTVMTILANKMVQDRATKQVDYYDDDRETVILTHGLEETLSTSTRVVN